MIGNARFSTVVQTVPIPPDAHRDENQRFIVRADESLTAFVELDSTIL